MGTALVQAGRHDDALEQYRRVIELDTEHAMAHFNLGVLFALREDQANSMQHYEQALRIDPGYRDPRFNLANLLRRSGDCERAIPHYAEVIRLEPRFVQARVSSALCRIELGRYGEARQLLESSLSALPADPQLSLALAKLLAASPDDDVRNGETALKLAQTLVADRRDPYTLEALSMAQAETGRYEAAVSTQQEALSLSGGTARLVERLNRNLELYQQGRPTRDPR